MWVARRVLSPWKGTMFTGRETMASHAETSSLGSKSSRAALRMLNAQSFISSSLSTLHSIKVCIFWIWRKSANYICETQKACEKHRISWIFYSISTTLRRGELQGLLPSVGGNHPRGNLPSVGGKSPLWRAVQLLKDFAKYCKYLSFSRRFGKVFSKFLGSLLRNT